MIRELCIMMFFAIALPVTAAAETACPNRTLPSISNVKGLHVVLKGKNSERISEGIPLILAVSNSTSYDVAAQYEPLSETLSFDVFDSDGRCLSPREVPLGGRSIFFHNRFPEGVEVDLRANLNDWVPVTRPGTYVVIARFRPYLRNDHMRSEFRTEPITITVEP